MVEDHQLVHFWGRIKFDWFTGLRRALFEAENLPGHRSSKTFDTANVAPLDGHGGGIGKDPKVSQITAAIDAQLMAVTWLK